MGPARGGGNGLDHRLLLLLALAAATDLAVAQQPSPSSQGSLRGFSPSMAIVIVVLITAFFFLGFFSIYIRRCAGDPLGPPGEYRPGRLTGITFTSAARSRRQRGLDPAVVEAFPTMAYADVKAHKAGKGELECAVCLSEFNDDETLRLLPKCSHVFHPDCIDAWLASHVTCPVCRANLVPDAEAAAATDPTTEPDAPTPQQPPVQEVVAAPDQVTVVIVDAEETEEERIRREEAAELVRIGSLKRALRTKSGRRPAQFPRSHTTGHSLAAPAAGEAADRHSLRLPEHVLREIVSAGKLRRSTSLLALGAGGEWSSRRGFRGGRSVRLGRSGRCPASFLTRTFSAGLPAWGSVRRGEGGKVTGAGQA